MQKREPNFENMKKVLAREVPDRPVLFEIFMNRPLYERLAGYTVTNITDPFVRLKNTVDAFTAAGYDYCTTYASDFSFLTANHPHAKTRSLNANPLITDWNTFEKYEWRNPRDYENGRYEKVKTFLPEGMKLLTMGPGGILENLEYIVGYDNLCMMLYDDPELVKEISDHIGKRLVEYYEPAIQNDAVGFICYNDDWGFNTQTLLSPEHLREYIFPWVKRIVDMAHSYNKPCILHSCGYFANIIDDITDVLKLDARHSYEDNILPVEEAYETYGNRIAILGGIDLNFLVRETPETVYRRCHEMLERTADRGGYALGSGNSIPEYIPYANYMAMIRAAWEF